MPNCENAFTSLDDHFDSNDTIEELCIGIHNSYSFLKKMKRLKYANTPLILVYISKQEIFLAAEFL